MEVVFGIPFLTFSKVKVDFINIELIWKAYTITEALFITKKVQIIGLKEFAKVALDLKQEAFVVQIITLFKPIKMHPKREVQIATLIANEVFITILAEYSNFENVFSKEFVVVY